MQQPLLRTLWGDTVNGKGRSLCIIFILSFVTNASSHVTTTAIKIQHCSLTPKSSFIHYCSQFFPLTPPRQRLICFLSYSFVQNIIQRESYNIYIAFGAWLFSLSIRLTHVTVRLFLLFLHSVHWMDGLQFVHPFTSEDMCIVSSLGSE